MLEIRRFRDSDIEMVWDLHYRALGPVGDFLRDNKGKFDEDLHDIQNHYINNRGEFLIGTHDGKIICMGAIRNHTVSLAEIKRMRVYPEYQRKGYGRLILNKLEECARELGYSQICLDTAANNVLAQKFYEKNGYILVRRGERTGFALFFYEKNI